jgi:hypothetical protein
MSVNIHAYLKTIPVSRAFVIGLILILGIAVTTSFVWIQTDHLIAPPGVRVLDWLWRAFACRCPA